MKSKRIYIIIAILGICIFNIANALAESDLDDGIPMDDSIKKHDTIKEKDININYIMMKAKSDARRNGENVSDSNGSMGSAIIKEGARVKGDVIIIFEGDHNTVVNTK